MPCPGETLPFIVAERDTRDGRRREGEWEKGGFHYYYYYFPKPWRCAAGVYADDDYDQYNAVPTHRAGASVSVFIVCDDGRAAAAPESEPESKSERSGVEEARVDGLFGM